ncbi:MAG: YdcH family protein [Lautropia sp.]
MSQLVDNHPLSRDFPEFKAEIHRLKQDNAHFVKLNDEYEAVDKAIVRAEQGLEHLGHDQLESMKQQRVRLKDQLYALIRPA